MSEIQTSGSPKSILVVGGGISGMTAAVEAAEAGRDVYLVEKEASLGGWVARFKLYYPKMCPPACGLEVNYQRIRRNRRIRVLPRTEVRAVKGEPGAFTVTLRTAPRYVTESYGLCGEGVDAAPKVPDTFNLGLSTRRALHIPHVMAFPMRYHIEEGALTDAQLRILAEACGPGRIDPDARETVFDIQVGAIILATGWKPYDARKLKIQGYNECPDVITSVQMERLACADGPTGGRIKRLSDGKPAARVAFILCAGSRNVNHVAYCSNVCCMASFKQALYVRNADPEALVEVFYIDLRASGRLEDYLVNRIQTDDHITLTRGRVAEVTQERRSPVLIVVEDIMGGRRVRKPFDLVVLAIGVIPDRLPCALPVDLPTDEYGYIVGDGNGVFGTGMCARPADVGTCVQEATGAALKALIATQ